MAQKKVFTDYDVGETYHARGRTVTHSDIRMFIGATDATHPNHVNSEYAENHPIFDGIVVPGVLTLGLADAFCAQKISRPAAYGMNYGHDNIRYLEPVYVNDTISGNIEIAETANYDDTWGLLTLDVEMVNQDNDIVLVENHEMLIARSTAAVEESVEANQEK